MGTGKLGCFLGLLAEHKASIITTIFFPKVGLKSVYSSREADDIANRAFIGGKTNRSISDKPPSAYFPDLIEKASMESFAAQCIPLAPDLLEVSRYKDFLVERRRIIAARLNEFLGVADQIQKNREISHWENQWRGLRKSRKIA